MMRGMVAGGIIRSGSGIPLSSGQSSKEVDSPKGRGGRVEGRKKVDLSSGPRFEVVGPQKGRDGRNEGKKKGEDKKGYRFYGRGTLILHMSLSLQQKRCAAPGSLFSTKDSHDERNTTDHNYCVI